MFLYAVQVYLSLTLPSICAREMLLVSYIQLLNYFFNPTVTLCMFGLFSCVAGWIIKFFYD